MAQAAHQPLRAELSRQACDPGPALSRCLRCERLNLACTFLTPTKIRGPKKRANSAEQTEHHTHCTQYWTDDICDRDLFETMMQDYLTYLYPLVPIVHRPSFKKALQEEQQDEVFAALTVMIAALVVATMPARFQAYQAHDPPLRFSSRKEMVHFCYQKVMALRKPSYYDHLNFQKFAISYLLFAAFLQLGDHNWGRMMSAEAFQLARLLNLHSIGEYQGLNCIETQLRKKGFWLLFYCHVHGTSQSVLGERLSYLDNDTLQFINPEDLMPLEVPDELILENEVLMPANPAPCLETGFVLHSRVFWAAIRAICPKKAAEDPCPCIRAHHPQLQMSYFQDRLATLKHILDECPVDFQAWQFEGRDEDLRTMIVSQFSSLRVNIHVTHLWLQSLIMDQLEATHAHQQERGLPSQMFDQRALWGEREELCRQLFYIIYHFPPLSLETNGLHLANKVRDISASLLASPFGPDDPISKRVAEYVRQSSEVLTWLDRSESMNTMHLRTWVDTDRIRE
ncbi:beta-glucosidase [Penicillium sp. IBT 35674x]|nr:beta-glucosidase [Penicillium sp. IBT 35674x]